ncbi:uncharacterized protein LOC126845374 [Adelges cooleyi]|uniref:uncharacterized protein LOC126845374 n=1 Tax=Adelges cooleyi TaxID=133065 RepID=UPI00217F9C53|nr:uncharacterized protein LOC126845374 [Adelges cooleyi]
MFPTLFLSFVLISSPVLSVPQDFIPPSMDNLNIHRTYTYLKNWLNVPPNGNITINQFLAFVGPTDDHIELINGYFQIYKLDWLNIDNIDSMLFTCLIRFICIGTGYDPVPFAEKKMAKFMREEIRRSQRELL